MKRISRLGMITLTVLLLGMGKPVLANAEELPVGEITGYGVLIEEGQEIEVLEAADAELSLDADSVYNRMMVKKEEYPEGMSWTNADYYKWKGGYFTGGYGCAGFAFILSDAAFGTLPARILEAKDFSAIRVGDILRVNNDSHSVIVLEVYSDYVIVAEGNYNSSIHWGRKLTKSSLEGGALTYIMTRYPIGYGEKLAVTEQFTDVKAGSWYVDFVQFVFDRGIMSGKSKTEFGTTAYLTRAELATVIYNMEGKPQTGYESCFTDVLKGKWYSQPVCWLVENNIASGYGNGKFGVGDNITREQMAQMLYAYAGMKGYNTGYTEGVVEQYADSKKVSGWAKTAMNWAVSNGVMSGKGSGDDLSQYKLDPAGYTTRAECAAMLKNLLQAYEK